MLVPFLFLTVNRFQVRDLRVRFAQNIRTCFDSRLAASIASLPSGRRRALLLGLASYLRGYGTEARKAIGVPETESRDREFL